MGECLARDSLSISVCGHLWVISILEVRGPPVLIRAPSIDECAQHSRTRHLKSSLLPGITAYYS